MIYRDLSDSNLMETYGPFWLDVDLDLLVSYSHKERDELAYFLPC
jgi:hypothetical protein